MTGGRMIDLAMGTVEPSLAELTRMARMKTAALITFCCEAGAIMAKVVEFRASGPDRLWPGTGAGVSNRLGHCQLWKRKFGWAEDHQLHRFWGVTGLPHKLKRWQPRLLLTLICSTRRPIFSALPPYSLFDGKHNQNSRGIQVIR